MQLKLDIFWKRRDRKDLIYNIAYDSNDTYSFLFDP